MFLGRQFQSELALHCLKQCESAGRVGASRRTFGPTAFANSRRPTGATSSGEGGRSPGYREIVRTGKSSKIDYRMIQIATRRLTDLVRQLLHSCVLTRVIPRAIDRACFAR